MATARTVSPSIDADADSSDQASLSRSSSRRTLRTVPSSSDPTSAHPLLTDPTSSGSNAPGAYAVYDKSSRKRAGSNSQSSTVLSPPFSTLSPNEGPLAPSPSSSTGTTSPFAPSSTHSLPPLISRPSSTQLPPPAQGRQYARSVSEAKEQLQRQALKAELQDLGLSAESAGAALVARLGTLDDDADLKSLSVVIRSGKLTLLLPAERLDLDGRLGLPFLLDHLVLLDPPSSAASETSYFAIERPFVTLSGLRGVLSGGELVFTSCVAAPRVEDSPAFHDEGLQRSLRGVTLLSAPPTSVHYPSSTLISAITTLSIPQTRSPTVASPPPTSRTTSRLAALFAKPAGQTPEPASSAAAPDSHASPSAADATDARSTSHNRALHSVEIPVLAVGKIIRHDDVASTITSALLAQLRQQCRSIKGAAGETDVAVVVDDFARQFEPSKTVSGGIALNSTDLAPSTSLLYSDVETLTEAYQEMMHDVRLDFARNLGSAGAKDSGADAPSLEDFAQLEERIDASLEKLEAAVTSTMYDRLFAPSNSHDLQEDENLASRIAALNVLGLDLEHLGIDLDPDQELEEDWHLQNTGPRDSLEAIASRVGKELNRLEDPSQLTPVAKLAILVECHKIIVDGLSNLPAVRLKKEVTADDKGSIADRPTVVEMDDASSRSSSLPPSRPRSPTPNDLTGETTLEDDLLRTPRPPSLEERPVPEIRLPEAAQGLSASVLEATSSSMLPAKPSPPTSIFETSRSRGRASPSASNSSSADLILPLLIYSVVRANPPHLFSHLRYIHRFRAESLLRGQASYAATNFDAVIEWSQHVDLSTLGLSSDNVITAAAASPSQQHGTPSLTRPRAYTTPSTFLRERVSLTADQLVDSANSALTGVVDSSYRLLFGTGGLASSAPRTLDDVKNVLDGARGRAREKLPFRRSNSARDFPTLIAGRRRATSVAINKVPPGPTLEESPSEAANAVTAPPPLPPRPQSPIKEGDDSDARSVRSVSSFLGFRDSTIGRAIASHTGGHASDRQEAASPENSPSSTSLGGRLLGRIADGASSSARRATLLNPLTGWAGTTPSLAPVPASPAGDELGEEYRPHQRFLDVESAQDLKLSEVQDLLLEYRKAVAALRARPAVVQVSTHEDNAVDASQAEETLSLDEKSVQTPE